MKVFRGNWSSFEDVEESVVTVGSFDGLHLGHREVIGRVTEAARTGGLRSVVMTFENHPRDVMDTSEHPVPLLTTTEEKLDLIAETGVDLAMVIQFDHALGSLTPHNFVKVVLAGRVGMRHMVVGFNHAFGRGRAGDRESLIAMSREIGFTVEVVNPTRVGDLILSSTKLRAAVAEGNLRLATAGLGRYYSVTGTVIHGYGRGRRLGCPTANLGLIQSNKLSPRDGIYAGYAVLDDRHHPSAVSIGYSPTFGEGKHSLEAHLIGFDGDLYDRTLKIEFVERLRGEEKYNTEQELMEHIQEDIRNITRILTERGEYHRISW